VGEGEEKDGDEEGGTLVGGLTLSGTGRGGRTGMRKGGPLWVVYSEWERERGKDGDE